MNNKTSKYIVAASMVYLESMNNYASSIPKIRQVGDFTCPTESFQPRITKDERFKAMDAAFRKLAKTIKQSREDIEQKSRDDFQKKEEDLKNRVNTLKQELEDARSELGHEQRLAEEAKLNAKQVKEKLIELERSLERQRRENEALAEAMSEERDTLKKQIAEAVTKPHREEEVRVTKSMQVWLEENALTAYKPSALKDEMAQIYDETLTDLKTDILKLLETLQYDEIRKHDGFKDKLAFLRLEIDQLLTNGDETVAIKYKELVSALEEERARLQRLINEREHPEDGHVRDTLNHIDDIMSSTKLLDEQIDSFDGSKGDKTFLNLEHKLLSNIMKIDVIQTLGHEAIRKKRAEVVAYATKCMTKLETKDL